MDDTESKDDYRQRIMDIVCGCMAEGKSLRQICKSVGDVPAASTICLWLKENSELAEQYARARLMMADYRFDEYRDAADEIVREYIDQGWEPKDAISMAKLKTGNMQWEITKLAPKVYGDKMTIAGDPENPLHNMTDEELLAKLERLRK